MNEANQKKALNYAMQLCSRTEYCKLDIVQKIKRYDLTEAEQHSVINKLESEGFINESRYIRSFVHDKQQFSGWGKQKIRYTLQHKGLSEIIIDEALNNVDEEAYLDQLKKLLLQKKKQIKYGSDFEMNAKLFRYALSRGFESELIWKVINQTV